MFYSVRPRMNDWDMAPNLMNRLGFASAITPLALSPGASFTLAMNNTLQRGLVGTLQFPYL